MLRGLIAAVVVLSCSCIVDRSGLAGRGPDAGERDVESRDAGPDGGSDATTPRDGGRDVVVEVADGGRDGGVDGGSDGGLDAGTDAGRDAGTDAGRDAGTDAGERSERRCRADFDDVPGFLLCAHAEESCEIYVRFSRPDVNCSNVCSRRGTRCVGSYDNARPDDCTRGPSVDCGGNPQDRICICSRTDDDDDDDDDD